MRIFRIIGILLLLILVAWIAVAFTLDRMAGPELLGIGSGFTAIGHVTGEQINEAMREGHASLLKEVDARNAWHRGAEIAGWISFALTAVITLIAGAQGQPIAGAEPTAEERAALIEKIQRGVIPESRRPRLVLLIGLFAAISSVLTATASRLEVQAQQHNARVGTIQKALEMTRARLTSANINEQEAQNALESLRETCIHPD
ncbi:MAG TPA: hypothetical protein VJ901_14675 [Thermoanaerobaculia bacterium]|nr:hypothetical protein [Thermoanaerobaculia bacterium]